MTNIEKQRRREDVTAAAENLRDVIIRATPRGYRRSNALECARAAKSWATQAIRQVGQSDE